MKCERSIRSHKGKYSVRGSESRYIYTVFMDFLCSSIMVVVFVTLHAFDYITSSTFLLRLLKAYTRCETNKMGECEAHKNFTYKVSFSV